MAETKQGGGFHAFEQRVHQIEEEDRKAEKKGAPVESGAARQAAKGEEKGARKDPPRK